VPELRQVEPKYLQIANHIRDQILNGTLQPGDEVPSERQIAANWSVARPTAARALEALRNQGLVESRQGAGTFVRDQRPARRARERYLRSRQLGRIYGPGEYAEIVAAEIVRAPSDVAEALRLPVDAEAIRRHRITHGASGPMEVSTSWFTADLAMLAPLLLERERIRPGTVSYVESVTGRTGDYARDQVAARTATEREKTELQLGPGTQPVLVYRHTVYDAGDQPIEYAEAVYPPERWTFEQEYPLN
jgi:DNA-binding GntR family transcriptional regulator